MAKLKIIDDKDRDSKKNLVKLAISKEIKRLEISLDKTNKIISEFEKRYKISSEYFLENYSAESLDGKDEEYIRWSGEIQIRSKILTDLSKLKEIEYETQ